ncbi:hypothetical protein QQF64_013323 [Cirrhinus molitorella]|uniref:Uncharacterized protein n=1 Tax=Cirrhinus molitorella TaxID=172907 RepID=A0ABR3LQU8_9TELE
MCAEWGVGRAERDPIERRREDRKDAGMGEEGSLGPRMKRRGKKRKATATHLSTCSNQVQHLMPFRFTACSSRLFSGVAIGNALCG